LTSRRDGVWPGNVPGLNPLEGLWVYLKNPAHRDPIPNTCQEIITKFEKKFIEILDSGLENRSQSYNRKVEEAQKANGGLTTYWLRTYKKIKFKLFD
jgi:hypothetical protein